MKFRKLTKPHKHHWVLVTDQPWLKTFGGLSVLHCSICGQVTNVPKDCVDKIEAKTRL